MSDRLAGVGRRVALEVWGFVVAAALALVAIQHLVTTPWIDIFFYNADSIVLPLMEQSLQRGESFGWVLSSQLFLFPEAPIYVLSTIFNGSPQAALTVNAMLNMLLLYTALRLVAREVNYHSRHTVLEVSSAVAGTLLFTVFVLLEPLPAVNTSGTASLFLTTTYYYGTVLVGLALVIIILPMLRGRAHPASSRRLVLSCLGLAALVTLGSLSNPLVAFQVAAPALVTLALLAILAQLPRREWLAMSIAIASGVGAGLIARRLFSSLVSAGVADYVSFDRIPASIDVLTQMFNELLSGERGTLKLLLVLSVLAAALLFVLACVYRLVRPDLNTVAAVEFAIAMFVTVSTASLLFGLVITGSITTRYLLPLYLFPLVFVVVVSSRLLRLVLARVRGATRAASLRRFATGFAGLLSLGLLVSGSIAAADVASASSGRGYSVPDCVDQYLTGSGRSGVASFWLSRPIELYGDARGLTLQVNPDLTAMDWMINLDSYDGAQFSYVLVDRFGMVTEDSVGQLGEPARVVSCPAYDIYDYAGTPGERELSRLVSESVRDLP